MILACHQPQYLAWPGYYHKMAACDVFVYLDDVQYKRREFQNRNRIKTPAGRLWLTVPVLSRGLRGQRIRCVKTDPARDWAVAHLETLRHCYAGSPSFKEHEPFLRSLYVRSWPRLMDLCLAWDRFAAAGLGIATRTVLESEAGSEGRGTERILSLCRRLGCDSYLSGTGGRDYLDEAAFRRAGIRLRYQEFRVRPYPQRFGRFVPGLCTADMLFNCGFAESRRLILGACPHRLDGLTVNGAIGIM
ncbi:MAG: WbqC family protein [Elusimicrobia bacterium]|nr:WbqC family protein [Elusimicrobiota bacterium]